MGAETESKTESETGPLKKAHSSEQNNPVFQKEIGNGSPKGGTLWSARLLYVVLLFVLDFWDFRTHFGPEFVLTSEVWASIFFRFLGSRFHIWERGLGASEPTLDHNL